MMSRIALVPVLLLAAAPMAAAQAPTSSAPAAQPLGGPAIPGVCLLSREAVFANAAVGKAAAARLQELTRTAQAEIDGQRTPIETEARALEGQPDNPQNKAKRTQLATRWQTLQQSAAHNSREMDATRAKVLDRLATEAQPVIAQVYTQKKCGLLLDRAAVLGGNFTNDLTTDVVTALDAKIKTITFERERLPQQAAATPPR